METTGDSEQFELAPKHIIPVSFCSISWSFLSTSMKCAQQRSAFWHSLLVLSLEPAVKSRSVLSTSKVQASFPDNQVLYASLAQGHKAYQHSKEIQNAPSCFENGNRYYLNMFKETVQTPIVSCF